MDRHLTLLRNQILNSELIIFDFDGTLVNLEQLNYDSLQKVVLHHLNENVDMDYYREVAAGTPSLIGIKKVFAHFGVTEYDFESVQNEFRDNKRLALKGKPGDYADLIINADIFVEKLHREGKQIAIASASSKEFITRLLSYFNMLRYFETIVSSEDVKLGKPNPEAYDKVINKFGVKPERVTIFEDSLNGLKAGKASGGYVIGIHNPGWNDKFVFDVADVVVEDYRECIEAMNLYY